MTTATLRVIRHSGGQEDVTYRNLKVDGFNPDIIVGESDIAQLILQGNVYDEGVEVGYLNMQADGMYTADIACVNSADFFARTEGSYGAGIRAKVARPEHMYINSYQVWFRIIDDAPSSITFRFDYDGIWNCRVYQDVEEDKLLLVFMI